MSVSEVRAIWANCQQHVENVLQQATSPEQMLLFVDKMCEYFRTLGHKDEIIKELKILIELRCFDHASRRKQPKEEIKDFNPYTETYIVFPKQDVERIQNMIKTRNTQVKNKIIYRTGPI